MDFCERERSGAEYTVSAADAALEKWRTATNTRLKGFSLARVQKKEVECAIHFNFDSFADGLTDCADSRCCSHPSCQGSIMCVFLADPVEVLLRRPPPSVDASFYQRARFLFEGEKSVQSYVKADTLHER